MRRIAIFGLGYVGVVSAACFAGRGHSVVGVDPVEEKVGLLTAGRSPIVEEHIGELVTEAAATGRLRATTDVGSAIDRSDIALVCVGTPSTVAGGLDTTALERVAEEIGAALRVRGRSGYTVVFRSTMLPGTCEGRLVPLLEESSGLRVGSGLGVAVNPEYLREGSSVRDFHEPAKTVVGATDEATSVAVMALYDGLPGERFHVPIRVAEMAKYVDNCFHALKVGFANEIGAICAAFGLDSHQVMDVFKSDRKLNISDRYLTPGFAFGGSCLPKDLRAITHAARHADVAVPILESILPSNDLVIDRVRTLVESAGDRRVGMLGLSFKPGTDDLRESPLVALAERLVGRGYDLRIYDPNVSVSLLRGANRRWVDERLPHLTSLLTETAREAVEHGTVVVVGVGGAETEAALAHAGGRDIVDLVRITGGQSLPATASYRGLAW